MNIRSLIAGPAYAALRLRRAFTGDTSPAGAFRVLILHGIDVRQLVAFERLLQFAGDRFGFLTPDEAAARLDGVGDENRAMPAPCLLSFDDGFVSNYEIVAPVLARYGLSALFFVCPGLVDLDDAIRADTVRQMLFRGKPPPSTEPLMTWEQIVALQDAGHVIGAHSMEHRLLAGLGPDALPAAIGPDGERLQAVTGRHPDWFAYPFGDIGSIDANALGVIGNRYRYCRSGVRGLNVSSNHRLSVFADHVDLDQPLAWQKLAVSGGLWTRYAAHRATLLRMAVSGDQKAAP